MKVRGNRRGDKRRMREAREAEALDRQAEPTATASHAPARRREKLQLRISHRR